jgi:predicted ATPase/DNA-binding SARP family transcriptional activator
VSGRQGYGGPVRVRVLGPLEVLDGSGAPVPVLGAKQRRLLAALVVHAGSVVSVDRLAQAVWGEGPVADRVNAVQAKVSQLRRILEPGRGRAVPRLLVSRPPGYVLDLGPDGLDALVFERLATAGRAALGSGDHATAGERFRAALALWRGPALAEFADEDFAAAAAARWEEARLGAVEDRVEADLRLGMRTELVPELESLVAGHPVRERFHGQLMTALYGAGRQADALAVFHEARRVLDAELGVEPGPELRAVFEAVRRQDPALGARPAFSAVGGPAHRPAELSRGEAGRRHGAGVAAAAGAPASGATDARASGAGDPGASGAGDPGASGAGDPGASGPGGAPGSLPVRVTSFVGRDTEVDRVLVLLGRARLVTLTGPGGVGKTRLAVEAAARLPAGSDIAGGVWFVDLASVSDEVEVATAVADVLGIREEGVTPGAANPGGVLTRLREALRRRDAVLVLDNCEHLVDGVAQLVQDLLSAAPGLRLLCTSREALATDGELVWSVPSLRVPPTDPDAALAANPGPAGPAPRSPRELDGYAAVRLFVDRARSADPGFSLTADNAGAVAQLCRGLDGIPLALELAAARVRALGVHELARRLDDRFRLLGSRTGAVSRQRTLRAVVQWGWDLLEPGEQAVLRRLSVFAGGVTIAAAGEVCTDGQVDEVEVVDVMARLVDKSLLTVDHAAVPARYDMLTTIRQFALERLADAGEVDTLRDRHLQHVLARVAPAVTALRGHDQLAAARWLRDEHDNIRAALERTRQAGDQAVLARLTAALGWYWYVLGNVAEARRWLRAAAEPSRTGGAAEVADLAMVRLWGAFLALDDNDPVQVWSTVRDTAADLRRAGSPEQRILGGGLATFLAWSGGDAAAAEEILAAARGEATAAGDVHGTAMLDLLDALRRAQSGALLDAEAGLEAALRGFVTAGDRWGQVQCLNGLYGVAEARGDLVAAGELVDRATALAEEFGLTDLHPTLLSRRSSLALRRGDPDEAWQVADQARQLAAARGSVLLEAMAEHTVGVAARRRGDHEQARLCQLRAQEVYRVAAVPLGLALTLGELGMLTELTGEPQRAASLHREALPHAVRTGDPRLVARVLEGLAAAVAAAACSDGPTDGPGGAGVDGGPGDGAGGSARGEADRRRAGRAGHARPDGAGGLHPEGHRYAAVLLGAADRLRCDAGLPLPPGDRVDVDRATAAARAGLDTAEFERLLNEGRRTATDVVAGEAAVPSPW